MKSVINPGLPLGAVWRWCHAAHAAPALTDSRFRPRQLESLRRQVEGVIDGVDDLGSPGWVTGMTSVIVRPCEARKVVTSLPRYCSTTAAVRDRTSSNYGRADVVSHGAQRVGVWLRESVRPWRRCPGRAHLRPPPQPSTHCRQGPSGVGSWLRMRGEHSSTRTTRQLAVRGPAQVVVQPGDPGHAAQPQRHPPDIGAQPQPRSGIQRRHRHPVTVAR